LTDQETKRIAVIGAGGFAQEVRWLISEIRAAGERLEFAGYLLSDLRLASDRDDREALLGDFGWLDENPGRVNALALGIGDPAARHSLGRELAERYPDLDWPVLIHPTVRLDRESCRIGRGVLLCAGTIGTVNLEIEPFAMVNLACTLGHGARIGSGSVLNPTVNLSGGADLGERVLVGTGAQILQYVAIGDDAVVGAGAVVTANVPPEVTVVGIPAKPLAARQSDQEKSKRR
jgi:sugar O-acyltransferase (sialic acid O-acetyltransferase NeuD family)